MVSLVLQLQMSGPGSGPGTGNHGLRPEPPVRHAGILRGFPVRTARPLAERRRGVLRTAYDRPMTESSPTTPEAPAPEGTAPYGTGAQAAPQRRVRIPHLMQMKERGERWAMLTAYDMYTAEIFDEAGIPVLLVGDSAGNNVYGFETTVPVTVDHLVPLTRAVTSAAKRAMVVADLPFGSYQASPQQALATATRFMKEGLAHAVKLEGGAPMVPEVELLVRAGIPVMGHIGFTPQSEHVLGGYKVQGRGAGADRLMEDALALEAAGCFAIVMEMVPAPVAAGVTEALRIPTIGIGAGPHCDAQVLVWQDMAGLRGGRAPRFVKKYADLRTALRDAATAYAVDVAGGSFPAPEHSFES
ncbi:3-methyl-2-oxobutanoate hydroxymethyltransferase [Fodinibacter luteus]|uniref:3-methyl-2-oxobutanoate hydroxymethyltransferase n=2 Tax=Fodinibacter luteus TaxID=552064 RepID=A0ABP8KAY4_9MICO